MKNIIRLFGLLGKWRWSYFVSSALLTLAIFVRSLEPKVLQVAVDGVILFFRGEVLPEANDPIARLFYNILPDLTINPAWLILLSLGLLYLFISAIRGIFSLVASAWTSSSTEKAVKALRDRLFKHIQLLPLQYHNEISTGELIQRSTGDIDTIRNFILNQVVEVVRLTAIFVFSFVMMAMVNLTFALVSVAFVPLLAISSYIFFRRESKIWEEHEKEADKLNTIAQENLDGIRVVQAFAREEYEINRYDDQNRKRLALGLRHGMLHTFYWPFSDFFVLLQITLSVIVGGYFALNQQITVGELASFYTYIVMVAWPMRQVGRVLSQMGMASVAMGRIYDILEAPEEDPGGKVVEKKLKGELVFDHVSFSYKDGKTVLDNISLRINPGEKVAFVGPTGSGKSTIIKLLTKFYDPTSGTIYLDGKPLESFSKAELRRRIGVVLQKAFLFSTTIRSNISYTRTNATDEQIIHAATVAGIDEIRHVFPQGYETVVGERGVTLSGGQKQRIALARTLLSDPDILVLDDVTSAVDMETEFQIFNALKQETSGKTTLIISHRLTTIQQADRIFVFDKGKIVQEGSHEQLVQQEGYYKQIHKLQVALEEDIQQNS